MRSLTLKYLDLFHLNLARTKVKKSEQFSGLNWSVLLEAMMILGGDHKIDLGKHVWCSSHYNVNCKFWWIIWTSFHFVVVSFHYSLLAISFQDSEFSVQISAVRFQPSDIRFQIWAFRHQTSAFSIQHFSLLWNQGTNIF